MCTSTRFTTSTPLHSFTPEGTAGVSGERSAMGCNPNGVEVHLKEGASGSETGKGKCDAPTVQKWNGVEVHKLYIQGVQERHRLHSFLCTMCISNRTPKPFRFQFFRPSFDPIFALHA